ncbi:phage tail tape measure protein, partial [Xanthobacter sp. DSM 24535]|uniref:phage tail tape measure protein n=1 Tax=Roseixanthobacter psychrophilus TaxID=3119917 RepID=UPI0037278EB9
RLTAPLRGIQRQFERLSGLAKRIGVLGGAVAAISFMLPIQSAAAFDQKLRDIAVTAGLFGAEAEARIRSMAVSYRALALQVGLTSDQIADASGILVAAGMDDALANKLLPTIGRVSKAASAVPVDVAKVGFALNNTLKIQADQMEDAFGKLVTAGKLGRFEFKDMAKDLPELAAQMDKFGIRGMEAVETIGASLQIAMFGTDSTSAAANNFKNFLTKILSPETIKNFKKAGVDIMSVMQSAAAQGLNPIESAIDKVLKLTGMSKKDMLDIYNREKAHGKTDKEATDSALEQIKKIAGAEKLGGLFGDVQVLDFMLPMLANVEKYLEFKRAINASDKGVIGQDSATQMAGPATQLNIFNESVKQLGDRVGAAFATNLPMLNAFMAQMMGLIGQVDAAFPGAIDQVLSFAGAGLLLVTALGLLGPVFSVIAAGAGVIATGIGI